MKKGKKLALIIAEIVLAVGLAVTVASLAISDFNVSELFGNQKTSYEVSDFDAFERISIRESFCNVRIESTAGDPYIEYTGSGSVTHNATVDDGMLVIEGVDGRKWYEKILSFVDSDLTLYLPHITGYEIEITTSSGNVTVAGGISAKSVNITTVSGNVECGSDASEGATVEATSGNVSFNGCHGKRISAKTTSGEIYAGGAICLEASFESSSGEVELEGVNVRDSLNVKTTSGNIELDECDSAALKLISTSGNISGELLSSKIYMAKSTSGNINVPLGVSGGICEITTNSGNIDFERD